MLNSDSFLSLRHKEEKQRITHEAKFPKYIGKGVDISYGLRTFTIVIIKKRQQT